MNKSGVGICAARYARKRCVRSGRSRRALSRTTGRSPLCTVDQSKASDATSLHENAFAKRTVLPSTSSVRSRKLAGSGAVVAPRGRLTNLPPVYPPEAGAFGIGGSVLLLLDVDESGAVRSATILASSGSPVLDAAAVAAALRWTFDPARSADGSAVPARIRQRVGFTP